MYRPINEIAPLELVYEKPLFSTTSSFLFSSSWMRFIQAGRLIAMDFYGHGEEFIDHCDHDDEDEQYWNAFWNKLVSGIVIWDVEKSVLVGIFPWCKTCQNRIGFNVMGDQIRLIMGACYYDVHNDGSRVISADEEHVMSPYAVRGDIVQPRLPVPPGRASPQLFLEIFTLKLGNSSVDRQIVEFPRGGEMAMSPDGRYCAIANINEEDNMVEVFSAAKGLDSDSIIWKQEPIHVLKWSRHISSLSFSQSNDLIIVDDVYAWNMEKNTLIKFEYTEKNGFGIYNVLSSNGEWMAQSHFRDGLSIWNTRFRARKYSVPWLREPLAWSPDGFFACRERDSNAIWAAYTDGRKPARINIPGGFDNRGQVGGDESDSKVLCFSPDGRLLATLRNARTISLWKITKSTIRK